MSMKINKLEIENVKRIKAVKVEPKASGLTVIGGNNNQGKTSVLDSIAWALGGERYKPSQATREGSVIKARYRSMYVGVFFKRYIMGLWAAAEGIIYDMFDDARHVRDIKDFFQILINGNRYVSCDYGTQNAMCT